MNNAHIALKNVLQEEAPKDIKPWLRTKQTELTEIIEALEKIKGSNYWKVLCNKIFDGVLETLKSRLSSERDDKEIYRLQGQIIWADKYINLDKLITLYRQELTNITSKLNG